MPVAAIGHALFAGDADRAAELLEQCGEAVDDGSRAGTWLSQARALPDELIRARRATPEGAHLRASPAESRLS